MGRCIILGIALFSIGCGLSDYEQRMDLQAKRLDAYDKENAYLGDPLEPPQEKAKEGADRPALPTDIFLRPPKDTKAQALATPFEFQGLKLYQYPGTDGYNVFLAAAPLGEPKDGKETRPGEMPAEDFRNRVRGAVADFYRKNFKLDPGFPPAEKIQYQTRQVQVEVFKGPQPAPLNFEVIELTDGKKENNLHYSLYIYRRGPMQTAIVFQYPEHLKDDPKIKNAIEWSLKNFEIGEKAQEKRNEFARRKRR